MNGNKEYREWRKRVAYAKAANRGEVAKVWFEVNKLTPQTRAEFTKLMKKADKEFDEKLVR